MTIPLASAQSLTATNFNTSATVAADAVLANQYSDLIDQITTASSQGKFTVTYSTLHGDLSAVAEMLQRYGYATQITNLVTITVSWSNPTPISSPTVVLSYNQITSALGYTPYDRANPNGYISSLTTDLVTTALGYSPLQASSLSVSTRAGSSTSSLTYANGVFAFTPYALTAGQIASVLGYVPKTFSVAMAAALA